MSPLPNQDPPAVRMARAAERDLFAALARRAGAHGVYVGNDLAADNDGRSLATRGLAFLGRAGARALAWFGPRGNLIVVQAPDAPLDVHLAARAIVDVPFDWRIALGPEPVLAALAQALGAKPLLLRRQLYYAADPAAVATLPVDPRVRPAVPADLEALTAASLELNHADLHLDPSRVSRRWLRQATRERVQAGNAWVLGPVGAPYAKLDVGSQGEAGAVIEGVFTAPAHRARGYASALVHAVASKLLGGGRRVVCLHVAETNAGARRCYLRAGLREAMAVGLLLKAS